MKLKNKMKGVLGQLVHLGLAAALLCGLAAAQRSARPLSAEAYFKRGVAKMEGFKYEDAIKDYDQAIGLNPRVAKYYLNRGGCYYALHKVFQTPAAKDKAIADLSRAIELQSDLVTAYILRANLYFTWDEKEDNFVDNNKKALMDFSKAIELKPNDDKLYFQRAWFHQILNNYQGMIDDYTVVLRLDPADTFALFARAKAYRAIEKYELAIADYTALLKYEPNDIGYLNLRASAYRQIGKYDLATADYSQILKRNPKDVDGLLDRAVSFASSGKYEQAINDCTEILRLKPQDFHAHWFRAEYYAMVNKYEEAIADFTVALKMAPPILVVDLLKKRAAAYRKLNKMPEAEADEAAVKRIEENAKKYN